MQANATKQAVNAMALAETGEWVVPALARRMKVALVIPVTGIAVLM